MGKSIYTGAGATGLEIGWDVGVLSLWRGGFVLQDDEFVGGVGWRTAVIKVNFTIDLCLNTSQHYHFNRK